MPISPMYARHAGGAALLGALCLPLLAQPSPAVPGAARADVSVNLSANLSAVSTSTDATPARSGAITASTSRLYGPAETPLSGDGFDVRGKIAPKVQGRPVRLQVRRAAGWRTVAVAATRHGGWFRFTDVRLARSSSLRVRAPRWKAGARKLAPTVTAAVPVSVVREQTGTVSVLPPLAQPGPQAQAPAQGVTVLAQFTPARRGRTVVVQRRDGDGWTRVADTVQDAAGYAHVTLAPTNADGTPAVYRAVAKPIRGERWVTPRQSTGAVTARDFALLFEDTFSGEALDPAKWVDQLKDTAEGALASNRKCSRINPSTRHVADGVLHMGIAADPTQSGQLCQWADGKGQSGLHESMWNTQIMTRGNFEFRYGYAAARLKVQQAKGMHSAFWLQPHDIPHGPPALGTEIDVMEFFGDTERRSNGIASFVHWYEYGEHQQSGGIFPESGDFRVEGKQWWDNFHVFSVEWTPSAYIFRVDGREFHRETVAVSQAPEYLLLSMLTGDYEYKNLTADEWDQTAQVDWVRVWAP